MNRRTRLTACLCSLLLLGACSFASVPDDAVANLLTQAEAAVQDRDIVRARKNLTRILAMQPSNTGAMFYVGMTFFCEGEFEAALSTWQEVLEIEESCKHDDLLGSAHEFIWHAQKVLSGQAKPICRIDHLTNSKRLILNHRCT